MEAFPRRSSESHPPLPLAVAVWHRPGADSDVPASPACQPSGELCRVLYARDI